MNQENKTIEFSTLPEELQKIISKDAIILGNADGGYEIYQNSPVNKEDAAIICAPAPIEKEPIERDSQRYAPKGGSYSDLKKGHLSSLTIVVFQTYLPRDPVDEWFVSNNVSLKNYVVELILHFGLEKLAEVAAAVLAKYGLNLGLSALLAIAEGTYFLLEWMNYQQVVSASNNGKTAS